MSPECRRILQLCIIALALATAQASLAAGLSLPALFSNQMVLQFGQVIPVWGQAEPGAQVKVKFRHFSVETVADSAGRWRVEIGPLDAGGPDRMHVACGEQVLVIDDILCGEVWLCSGQSNMAMTVDRCLDAQQEIASADFPQIRQFVLPLVAAAQPRQDILLPDDSGNKSGRLLWQAASPETVGKFTAAGYFFARDLSKRLGGVPVGLINSSWGGSVAESWVSKEALAANPELAGIIQEWPEYSRHSEGWRRSYKTWLEKAEKARTEGKQPAPYYRQPSVLFNSMISPIIGYGMRGALWYQGESNATRPLQYTPLFQALISDWRARWGREFPFIWVQLPGWETTLPSWPLLREAQASALSLPNTAMAVAIDVGERWDIHPRNKQAVGIRLAIAARKLVYLEQLPHMGPLLEKMTIEGARCRIQLNNTGEGLTTADSEPPRGFEVAGQDRLFVPAEVSIEGGILEVWSPAVSAPLAVRYLWTDYLDDINLFSTFNGETWLPVAPFRTDDWDAMPPIELVD